MNERRCLVKVWKHRGGCKNDKMKAKKAVNLNLFWVELFWPEDVGSTTWRERETRQRFAKGAERIETSTKHFRDRNKKRKKYGRGFFREKVAPSLRERNKKPKLAQKKSRSKPTGDVFPVYELPGVGMLSFA